MATTITHPLEPLTAQEVHLAVTILKDNRKVTPTTRFVSISLKEPAKEFVHNFTGKEPIRRDAFAVLFDNGTNSCYEATISLADRKLTSWTHIPGVQPTMTMDEQIECEQAVLASPEFKAALKKHYGIDDTKLVMVDIWSAGNYGSEEDRTRRLARPLCFVRTDPTDNGYARPIEGLRPVVDLNAMKVIRVEEFGHWPLPPQSCNYAADRVADFRKDIKPLEITQPAGASFEVEGNAVRWQNWSFVIGFSGREGLTLHNLCYDDNGKKRSVLFRASLSEMVVPYGDPAPQQARKNAFDAGEYGLGYCANSLELGCDCLGLIKYFDGHLCTSRGEPLTIKNAVCMHEEDYGILWKHTDRRLPDSPEVRRSRRLVISSIATVENYEYGFFWYLYQDGNIQFEIKLTGILSLGALQPGEKSPYGAMIAPQLYAPNHQHFFNVRLDMDLDGTANSVYQIDVVPDELGPKNPFENAFSAKAMLAGDREAGAGEPEPGDGAKLADRESERHERGRRAGRLSFPARRQFVPLRIEERLVAQAGRLRQPSRVGDAVQCRGAPRGRQLPQPERRRRRPAALDGAGPEDRQHRCRALVHLRPHAPPAAGGLSRDADGVHRFSAEAARLLHREPGERRTAVGEEEREGELLSRVRRRRHECHCVDRRGAGYEAHREPD